MVSIGDPSDDRHPAPAEPSGREAWLSLRPWLGGLLLLLAALFGLVSASEAGAGDPGLYRGGLMLAVLAIAGIFLRIKQSFDGTESGLILDISIEEDDALWLFVPVMIALALAGIIVAAADPAGPYYWFGLALFTAATALIFINLKLHYDAKERP